MDGGMEHIRWYLSIRIDHVPARAAELVAYQCITTSASTRYPPTACLNYDIQFHMLTTSDPNSRWDIRHTDLWLQCRTAKPRQSTRWPCTHCGITNHYPDHCPFCPNPSPAITGGQRVTTRGQPSSRPTVAIQSNQPHAGTSTALSAVTLNASIPIAVSIVGPITPLETAPAKAGLNPLIMDSDMIVYT